MSAKIEPNAVEHLEDEIINRYELPEDEETVFWVDTSVNSYSVTWEVSDEFGVEDYVDFLSGLDESGAMLNCLAAFEERDTRVEADIQHVMDDLDYPLDCTYLRTEAEEFDMEWIEGDYTNVLVFSSSPYNEQLFHEIFDNMREACSEPAFDRPYSKGLEQVERVVSRNGGEDIQRELGT